MVVLSKILYFKKLNIFISLSIFCSIKKQSTSVFFILLSYLNMMYSVMQSDGNSFCGDVVLDSFNVEYRNEDSILDQIWKTDILKFCYEDFKIYEWLNECTFKEIEHITTRNSKNLGFTATVVLVCIMRIILWLIKIIIIIIRKYLLLYIWSKMLSSSRDALLKLTKTTSSQKLFQPDCITSVLVIKCWWNTCKGSNGNAPRYLADRGGG